MDKQRIGYIDTIRFVAMFMVIICHACDPFNAGATYGTSVSSEDMFFWGRVWGSLVRPCVPLFVMITGALCLTDERPLTKFWKHRIPRVLWPFLIWSVIYNLFPWFTGLFGLPEDIVYTFFAWATSSSQQLSVALERIAAIPYNFDLLACHMWYIYMLIGLYLFMPILGSWVRSATRRQLEIVLGIWAATTFMPYLSQFVSPDLFGECPWNGTGTFYYFTGFTGYLLLGYYLVNYVSLSKVKSVLISIPAIIVGFWITYWGFTRMTAIPDATPDMVELFWYYCTPNVAITTVGMYLLLSMIKLNERTTALMKNFSVCCFGIYMIHYFFIGPTYELVKLWELPTAIRVPLASLLVLLISWTIVALVKRYYQNSKWLLG